MPTFLVFWTHLWTSETLRWHRSGSILVQVMACCLTAPNHYLNQCWLIICKVQQHWSQGKFDKIPMLSISKISLKITYLNFDSNLPGASELNPSYCLRNILDQRPFVLKGFLIHFAQWCHKASRNLITSIGSENGLLPVQYRFITKSNADLSAGPKEIHFEWKCWFFFSEQMHLKRASALNTLRPRQICRHFSDDMQQLIHNNDVIIISEL